MIKSRVVIVGSGFAGLSAARRLSRYTERVEVILVDKYENSHFRPLIPDVVSRNVASQRLLHPILPLKDQWNFTFFCEPVVSIDTGRSSITLGEHTIGYDYLILTAGSQTAFPPNDQFRAYALRLDTVHDANRVRDAVRSGHYGRYVVCGGGYTGVETASNIRNLVQKTGMHEEVIVAEMTGTLLPSLSPWIQRYVEKQLGDFGVLLRLSSKVEEITEREVVLSTGERISDALCIWTTGLVAPKLTHTLTTEKGAGGRIRVDGFLRFGENRFAAGDIACCGSKAQWRLSVQAALDQGLCAAENVIAAIDGLPMKRYVHRDPGFIIPIASGKSCGEVYGVKVKGRPATLLHYLMSMYRSSGIVNRLGVLRGAMTAW